jgi:hypothetical protein
MLGKLVLSKMFVNQQQQLDLANIEPIAYVVARRRRRRRRKL